MPRRDTSDADDLVHKEHLIRLAEEFAALHNSASGGHSHTVCLRAQSLFRDLGVPVDFGTLSVSQALGGRDAAERLETREEAENP